MNIVYTPLTKEEASAKRKELAEKYKHFWPIVNKKGPNYSMSLFGFQIGDGWLKPIENLLRKLDWIRTHNTYIQNPKYVPNATSIENPYIKGPDATIVILDIKEKFGGIRVYYHGEYTEIQGNQIEEAIAYCEGQCDITCESCGTTMNSDGSDVRITRGWLSRCCDVCAISGNRSFPEPSDGDFE
jgi:hypothetical protein